MRRAEVLHAVLPGHPALELHPSRVVRFLGNPPPDPSLAGALWSDSVSQSLYDAVHAAALSLVGATSLLHEARVDVVTVPNLSATGESDVRNDARHDRGAPRAGPAAAAGPADLLVVGHR